MLACLQVMIDMVVTCDELNGIIFYPVKLIQSLYYFGVCPEVEFGSYSEAAAGGLLSGGGQRRRDPWGGGPRAAGVGGGVRRAVWRLQRVITLTEEEEVAFACFVTLPDGTLFGRFR